MFRVAGLINLILWCPISTSLPESLFGRRRNGDPPARLSEARGDGVLLDITCNIIITSYVTLLYNLLLPCSWKFIYFNSTRFSSDIEMTLSYPMQCSSLYISILKTRITLTNVFAMNMSKITSGFLFRLHPTKNNKYFSRKPGLLVYLWLPWGNLLLSCIRPLRVTQRFFYETTVNDRQQKSTRPHGVRGLPLGCCCAAAALSSPGHGVHDRPDRGEGNKRGTVN